MRIAGDQKTTRALAAALREAIADKQALARDLGLSKAQFYKALSAPTIHHLAFSRIAAHYGWEPDRTFEGFFRRRKAA